MHETTTTFVVGDELVDLEIVPFSDVAGWAVFTRLLGETGWRVSCLCPRCRERAPSCESPRAAYGHCAAEEVQPLPPERIRPPAR